MDLISYTLLNFLVFILYETRLTTTLYINNINIKNMTIFILIITK